MKFHLGVLGEASIAVVGTTAQNCASLFYAFAKGICNIDLLNLSKCGHAQIYPKISVLGHDDRKLIIACAPLSKIESQ